MVLKLSELEKFYAEYNYINGDFNLLDEIDKFLLYYYMRKLKHIIILELEHYYYFMSNGEKVQK